MAVVGVAACIAVYALSTQQPTGTSFFSNMDADDMEYMKFISQYG